MAGPLTFDDIEAPSGPLSFDDILGGLTGDKKSDKTLSELITGEKKPDKYNLAAQILYAKQKQLGLTGGYSEGLANRVLQGGTLGWGDEALAALETPMEMVRHGVGPSEGYKYAHAFQDIKNKQAKENTGAVGTVAEIGGSVLPGNLIMKGVQTVAAVPKIASTTLPVVGAATPNLPAVAGAVAPTASRLSALGQSIAAGTIAGGVQGGGDGTGVGAGAAAGALGGVGAHAVGRGLEGLVRALSPGARVRQAPATTEQLQEAAQNGYDAFTNAGGLFTKQGLDHLSTSIRDRLTTDGWEPEIAPAVNGFLRRLESYRQGGASGVAQMTPRQLQTLRKIATNIRKSKDDQVAHFGGTLVDELDNFLGSATPGHFTGRPGGASQADLAYYLQGANTLYKQFAKSAEVDHAVWKAENRAGSTYSGGNLNNATRQNLKGVWEKRGPEGYTPDENAAFQTAVRGGPAENIARGFGKLAASRGGLSAMAQLGAMLHSPHIAVPLEIAAEISKFTGDKLTKRNLDEVSRVIRSGGVRRPITPPLNAADRFTRRVTPLFAGPAGAYAAGLLGNDQQ